MINLIKQIEKTKPKCKMPICGQVIRHDTRAGSSRFYFYFFASQFSSKKVRKMKLYSCRLFSNIIRQIRENENRTAADRHYSPRYGCGVEPIYFCFFCSSHFSSEASSRNEALQLSRLFNYHPAQQHCSVASLVFRIETIRS